MDGATALAPRLKYRETSPGISLETRTAPAARRLSRVEELASDDGQSLLFPGELSSKVIPFDSFQRPVGGPPNQPEVIRPPAPGPAAKQLNAAKQAIRKQAANSASDTQESLDLEFLPPAPQTPRTLKTTVEASIYCDAPVAAPMHRSVATLLDGAMIFIGCGSFLTVFQAFGGSIRLDKFDALVFTTAVILISMFYGFIFAWAGRETAGQRWTELRLINFDGHPPDTSSRALRFAGSWLGGCAGGVGLLWALVDEENLAWHDHMSKTFLTLREANCTFFRERAR